MELKRDIVKSLQSNVEAWSECPGEMGVEKGSKLK